MNKFIKGNKKSESYIKKYKTKRWQKLRENVLKRDSYLCQESKRYGRYIDACVVHHIFPAREYPDLFYNPNNLISLSTKAHNEMHDRLTDELTSKGKDLQKRYERRVFGDNEKRDYFVYERDRNL